MYPVRSEGLRTEGQCFRVTRKNLPVQEYVLHGYCVIDIELLLAILIKIMHSCSSFICSGKYSGVDFAQFSLQLKLLYSNILQNNYFPNSQTVCINQIIALTLFLN